MSELIFPKKRYTMDKAIAYVKAKYGRECIVEIKEAGTEHLNHIIVIQE